MRNYDDDEEEDFDEENDEDEEMLNGQANGVGDDADDPMEFYEDDGSGEENEDEDGDGDGDEDDEEDDEDDEDGDEEDEDDEDEDEDEDEDAEAEGEDVDMNGDEASSHGSRSDRDVDKSVLVEPQPPHLARRALFKPIFKSAPISVSIEAIVAIPLPCAVHSLAATACSSYLLTGGSDGHIRAYDFWGSVNGKNMMTAQQKTMVGLGEGVNKTGVARGWWSNEVDCIKDGQVSKRLEGVYSLAVEGDGMWALTGTQSGPINLYTLRHAPGHLVYSLKGHSNVVSCLTLLPNEKGVISGSWDGSVREWDLNSGQIVRQYPTHGAQISSLALRPYHPPSPSPSPVAMEEDDEDNGEKILNGVSVSINIQPNGVKANGSNANGTNEETDNADGDTQSPKQNGASNGNADTNGVDEAKDDAISPAPSPYDPLFDDEDADGETVAPSGDVTTAPTPTINELQPPTPKTISKPSLALPGALSSKPDISTTATSTNGTTTPLFNLPQPVASSSKTAAAGIPLLSPSDYKAFSDDILLTSSMDGQVVLIDRRIPNYTGSGVGRLQPGEKAPPWCMSATWLSDGKQILAGRRNGTLDIWDVRKQSSANAPNLLRTLRTPAESGFISCVSAIGDGRHVVTASQDNVRLWNVADCFAPEESMKKRTSRPPFKIIAGHHGGTVSSMHVDPTCRFLITASGDRGWQGEATKLVLVHEIKW